jgi:hypothetical protein
VNSKSTAFVVLACTVLVCSDAALAQFSQEGPKLVAPGGGVQGLSVSLSGDGNTAIVGAPFDSGGGGAWIWTRSGGFWTPQVKLTGSGAVGSAGQGSAVALSADGNTAVVGGPYDNPDPLGWGGGVGAAWIWTRSGGAWTQQAKLVGADAIAYSFQGGSVAISSDGNTAIVGGPGDNGGLRYIGPHSAHYIGYGAAWVWTRSGGVWTQQGGKLVGSDPNGSTAFASQGAVALSSDGNTAIVGGANDGGGYGAAWVWTRSGGAWTQQANKLVGSGAVGYDSYPYPGQGAGVSLSGDGNTALVGGPGDIPSGAAWVWTRSGGVWNQQGEKLVGSGVSGAGASQGDSVALSSDGNTAIIGGTDDGDEIGATWVWMRSGGIWAQQGQKLVGSGGIGHVQQQGGSVALSGDGETAIVGGSGDNEYTGAAWVFGPSARMVPIVVSTPGLNGSFFTSELALTNPGASDASITYTYTSAFGGESGSASDTLAAGAQKIIPDAVEYLKTLGIPVGDASGRGGTLLIGFLGAGAATVRTTAAVPNGRAGLAYAGLSSSQLMTDPVYVCGLRQNATDRSNVAVLNAGTAFNGSVTLRLTVVSGDPAQPWAQVLPDIALPPGGFSQISGVLASNGLSLTNGYVRVERVAGSAPFYAYGVINDQANSDGSFVEPVASNPSSAITGLTLPVLVETGAYSSELVVTNFTTAFRTFHAVWVARGLTGGQVSFDLSLLPNEQQILPSFVQLLRSRGVVNDAAGPGLVGALFVTDATGDLRGVSVAARTSTTAGGGRYGVFYSAVPAGGAPTASAGLYDLRQDANNRTNLALVNVGSTDTSTDTFRVDLFDGEAGQKAGSVEFVTVPAMGFVQIDSILREYAPTVSAGYALVTKTGGNNPFIAYAVINDGGQPGERSGDGTFVKAEAVATP